MTTTLSQTEQALRQVFKVGNRFMVLLFRLGLGDWGNSPRTSQVMVLVHRGRKSGLQRRTPVNFTMVGGDIYCTAAFGTAAHWYQNIMAEPKVEVWLPSAWYAGVAEEVPPDDPRRDELMREVLIASGVAAPLFAGMNPQTATEEELAELTANYRLIRIRRTEARTGPGGPGDLAWVWPAATFVLLGLWLLRPRRR
jgi:deazaflavin-dependent oxidoreductase (nitroreductase family)